MSMHHTVPPFRNRPESAVVLQDSTNCSVRPKAAAGTRRPQAVISPVSGTVRFLRVIITVTDHLVQSHKGKMALLYM